MSNVSQQLDTINNNETLNRIKIGHLYIDPLLYNLVNQDILPNTGIDCDYFWQEFESIIQDLSPKNIALLLERDHLQSKLNQWHTQYPGTIDNDIAMQNYQSFLKDIGYLLPEPADFTITTTHIDCELSQQAGPQLVVPILNARYALNAVNARWGSLYDALYSTDVISEDNNCNKITQDGKPYNAIRGEKVIAYGRYILDCYLPLNNASHSHVLAYRIIQGKLQVLLNTGITTDLVNPNQCIGYQGDAHNPSRIMMVHHNLHLEIVIDRSSLIGSHDLAGISDIFLEAALSTILDLEDSVAVVDTEDKVLAYRNWLGIIQGNLTAKIEKNGHIVTRGLNPDRFYTTMDGIPKGLRLHGRSLMFLRNVGHLMTHRAILYTPQSLIETHSHTNIQHTISSILKEIPEGIMDAVISTSIALHDLHKSNDNTVRNSREKSIYIVKPKLHGPNEVAFTCELFSRVETLLGLNPNTIKLGIMDEERRTSINLKACIAKAKDRIVFINTGFLDRTGDEIHSTMYAGAMLRKADMKHSGWLNSYELNNVVVGLACGLKDKAQIGKGMWAMPDLMADMLKQKIAQVQSGANTAWVPSPTAATLHALHYHQVNISDYQNHLYTQINPIVHTVLKQPLPNTVNTVVPSLNLNRAHLLKGMLTVPVANDIQQKQWTEIDKQKELDNNIQSILGYVVRWIHQGIGCSKVPDINGVYLMEDRATLRISSQHIANWLHHGILTKPQVLDSFKRMAAIVDTQNAYDLLYTPLISNTNQPSIAYQAAMDLIFQGVNHPNGYTELTLHAWRLHIKALQKQ